MEQPRRLLLFLTLSLGFMLLWSQFVMKRFQPPNAPDPAAVEQENDGEPVVEADGDSETAGETPEGETQTAEGQGDTPNTAVAAGQTLEEAEATTATIGSTDPNSNYYLKATITSIGAAIDAVEMSDPKFLELDRSGPLKIVGATPTNYKTFATGVDIIDAELKKQDKPSLAEWNWKYLKEETEQTNGVNSKVVFAVTIAGIEVRKTYSLAPVELKEGQNATYERKVRVPGYLIDCHISFRNVSGANKELTYELQGPVGVRLENEEHARENRKLQIAFNADTEEAATTIPAATVVKQFDNDELETWKTSFRYVGVDNTYFAALILADPEQQTVQQIDPMVVDANRKQTSLSDVSLLLKSEQISLGPNEQAKHFYQFFAGPKRRELLDKPPLEASKVLNLGWFGPIARVMLNLLGFFHNLGLPYGLAIICLTVLVRGCMFPLSKRQVASAQKMKELQPQIQALKDKYGDDKEKIAKAQMELFAKNKYNPFAGCAPLLVQMPIFIGLYTALYHATDLRLAKFLWIDNLAAPDATFRLPFAIPFLGQDVSILPIITVVLFMAQQKLFMPEPQNEEQAMQQKMMSYMTLFFGFFFWHSPAGLCLYFIASSLWGITERKLLAKMTDSKEATAATEEADASLPNRLANEESGSQNGSNGKKQSKETNQEDKEPGFFKRIWLEAQEAANQANQTGTVRNQGEKNKNKKKKKRR